MKIFTRRWCITSVLAVLFMITGYFLRAILIPVQDIEVMKKTELVELQKEMAINYPLGTFLFYIGVFMEVLCLLEVIARVVWRAFSTSAN